MSSLYMGEQSNILMNNVTLSAIIVILAGVGILATSGITAVNTSIGQTVSDNATMAGNMTGGNMTGGNMTGGNMTMGGGNMSDSNMTEAVGEISKRRCGDTCYTDSA